MSFFADLLRGVLIIAGLLLPGLGWAVAARWPLPWFAAMILSALAVFSGIVGLCVLGINVSLGPMVAWLGLVAAGGVVCWWRCGRPRLAATWGSKGGWWIALPAVPMLLVAVWRAVAMPLPGADVDFRWDHLARLIVESGGMDFYPPVTPEGFAKYFWADGIAPLASGVYVWTYLAAGSTTKYWTALPVLLQLAGLVGLLPALAQLWQPGHRSGAFACGLAGGVMLLQFAFNLGQETGWTALGAGGMATYLLLSRREDSPRLWLPAAMCAGLVSCAREYGGLFLAVGVLWLAVTSRDWRRTALFCVMAAVWPIGWHLRIWHLTGNPLYAHNLAGLFPHNPVFSAWMQAYVANYGSVLRSADGWLEIGRLLMVTAMPAVVSIFAGLFLWKREPGHGLWVLLIAANIAAWVASVPFTAGGLFYSMRVLSPALLLGCAWGGAALAHLLPQTRLVTGVLIALGLLGSDAALRALTIPLNPYETPVQDWPRAGYVLQSDFAVRDEPFLAAVAAQVTGRVLSESAGVQHILQRHGRTHVPLWSPEVRFLFEPGPRTDAADRLIELGYSHLLLTRVQSSVDFLGRAGVWKKLEGRIEPVMANDTFILFALRPDSPETPSK